MLVLALLLLPRYVVCPSVFVAVLSPVDQRLENCYAL
jgi:hypothetical protein